MDLKSIKSVPVNGVVRKRVGRGVGSGLGKSAGRGNSGARARSGFNYRPFFEGGQMPLFRRLPKKGFSRGRFATEIAFINVKDLNRFEAGSIVNPDSVRAAGLVKRIRDGLVVLGKGEVKVALTVSAHRFTPAAAEKIVKAGGKVEVIVKPVYNPRRPKK